MKKNNFKFLLSTMCASILFFHPIAAQNNALYLNGAYIYMNGGTAATPIYMVINQPNTLGIVRTAGHIHSENQYNYVEWITGTNTGSYVIPFGVGGTAADYIPLGFNKTNAANITLTVSTYSTNTANAPMPGASTSNGGAVAAVSSIPQSANAIDRYWDIKTNAAVNADLTFSYRGIENTITGAGYCTTDTIKAQNWNGGAWNPLVGPGNPGVTIGIGSVGPIPFTSYAQFVLASVPVSPTVTPLNATLTCTSPNTTATVLTTGGLGPYSYTWSPAGGTGSVATISSPGTYTVTVAGSNGCSKTATVSVTQNTTAPSITAAASGSLNCTTNTVLVSSTVTPSSGINYNWSGPGIVSGAGTGTITVNQGGTYQLTVTNTANGCTATASQAVTQNTTAPSITAAASGSLNCTTNTVLVSSTVTPSSGITYNWSGPSIVSGAGTGTITVNQGGTYQLTVTNTANGCTATASQAVTQNTTAPSITAAASGSLNCTTNTVLVSSTVTPSSGITYNWSGPSIVSGAGTGTITVNQGGTYQLTVTNTANGCTATASQAVTQNTTAPSVTSAGNATLTCASSSVNISASSIPSTGVTINWLGGVCGPTNSFTTQACASGTYTIEVTDNTNGCTGQATSQVIPDSNLPNISAAPSGSINCTNNTVQVVANTTVSPVTYTWSGSGITGGNGTATITVNQGGTYQVTVTNTSNGCSNATVITVIENTTAPTVAASPSATLNCINSTVQITSTVNPTSVSYNWSGPGIVSGAGTGTVTVNQPGTYSLIVTDASNNCTTSISTNVTQDINTPSITTNPNPTLTCSSTSVSIGASSNPNTNVNINWTGPNVCGSTSSFTTDACVAGTYTITVTDNNNGCFSSATIAVIPDTNIPVVTANSNGSITCSNNTVEVVASTTSSPVSYTWNGSGVISGANSASATVNAGGTYTVIVMNTSNGCSTTQTLNVSTDTNPPSVTMSASNPSISCTNGTVNISVSPVNASDTYLWSGAGTFTGQGTPTISTTTSGTYQVVVTNTINGCATTQSTNIGFDNNLTISVTGNTLVCQGSNIVINASGATNYTWTDGTNTYTTSSINIPASANTTFTLTGTIGACNSTTIIGISVSPSINVSVSISPSNSINIGDNVQLNATGASNYTWTPITGLINPTSPSPIANPVQTTTYCVIGLDNSGVCSDSACLRIYVDTRCPEIFVPNVFSPNKDNINDKLHILGLKCVKEFTFVIFDRWGEKIFETNDKNAEWDGTYNGKDMSGATFIYYLKGVTYDDKIIDKKGNITIVK